MPNASFIALHCRALRNLSQVGDRLDTDVSFASQGEFSSALVLTGVASADDAKSATGPFKPTFLFQSFAALAREEEWHDP